MRTQPHFRFISEAVEQISRVKNSARTSSACESSLEELGIRREAREAVTLINSAVNPTERGIIIAGKRDTHVAFQANPRNRALKLAFGESSENPGELMVSHIFVPQPNVAIQTSLCFDGNNVGQVAISLFGSSHQYVDQFGFLQSGRDVVNSGWIRSSRTDIAMNRRPSQMLSSIPAPKEVNEAVRSYASFVFEHGCDASMGSFHFVVPEDASKPAVDIVAFPEIKVVHAGSSNIREVVRDFVAECVLKCEHA